MAPARRLEGGERSGGPSAPGEGGNPRTDSPGRAAPAGGGWEGGRVGRRAQGGAAALRACARPLPSGHAHAGHAALARPARVTRWRRRLRSGARGGAVEPRVTWAGLGARLRIPSFCFPLVQSLPAPLETSKAGAVTSRRPVLRSLTGILPHRPAQSWKVPQCLLHFDPPQPLFLNS